MGAAHRLRWWPAGAPAPKPYATSYRPSSPCRSHIIQPHYIEQLVAFADKIETLENNVNKIMGQSAPSIASPNNKKDTLFEAIEKVEHKINTFITELDKKLTDLNHTMEKYSSPRQCRNAIPEDQKSDTSNELENKLSQIAKSLEKKFESTLENHSSQTKNSINFLGSNISDLFYSLDQKLWPHGRHSDDGSSDDEPLLQDLRHQQYPQIDLPLRPEAKQRFGT